MLKWLFPTALSLCQFAITGMAAEQRNIWLLVETTPHVLKVMEEDEPVEIFEKIAIGRRGVSWEKLRGDDKTPIGRFRIGWINEKSRYRKFFGFTFPNRQHAEHAYETGMIGEETYNAILNAEETQAVPPQNTRLGGQFGIHGLGGANRAIHENFDWTHGCIAMTNEQIDRLSSWVRKGTLVVIR